MAEEIKKYDPKKSRGCILCNGSGIWTMKAKRRFSDKFPEEYDRGNKWGSFECVGCFGRGVPPVPWEELNESA